MNSVNYLTRQLDVLASTPPSTPLPGQTFNKQTRAKSYIRIAPSIRRRSQAGGLAEGQDSDHNQPDVPYRRTTKRSFSSPALWSFRKPSLTPTASTTPLPVSPKPTTADSSSYDFPSTPDPMISQTPPTQTSFLIRILSLIWNALGSLCLTLASILLFQSTAKQIHILDGSKSISEPDTAGEESEDDVLVTRAPKRSNESDRYKHAEAIAASLEAYQMSTTTITESITLSNNQNTILSISHDPPSPEEVKRRTETPRIDLIPAESLQEPQSTLRRRKPDGSSSLLPNPLASSLLTNSSPVSTGLTTLQVPRKMPGLHMQKTLVLDLDETLIHSTSRPLGSHAGGGLFSMGGFGFGFGEKRGRAAGHMVEVVLGGRCTLYHVYKRPFVDYFLRKVSTWYTLVIFTASMQEYADPVIDWLDAGRGIFNKRLFRESCTQLPNGSYTKDLSIIEQDLSRVCLVDNSPISYDVNPANGIPIEGWISDPSDEALLHLLPVLDSLRFATDVRRILGLRLFN